MAEACPTIISLNTRTPSCSNKIIHLRATTKDAPEGWLTDLFCLNRKARCSFKQWHLIRGDVMSGTELVPGLAMIVHGLIVKAGLEVVK